MNEKIDRRKAPRLTITQILEEMQHQADVDFQGDLPDNALTIFNRLNVGDKKTFLRRSLELHWQNQIELARTGMQDVVIEHEVVIDPVSVEKERKSFEDVELEEQLRLKTWMSKVTFTLGLVLFGAIILITYFYGGSSANITDILKRLNGVADLLLK